MYLFHTLFLYILLNQLEIIAFGEKDITLSSQTLQLSHFIVLITINT